MFSHSNLFWFFSSSNLFWFLLISGNSMPYISCSKSGSVSGFLVLSHSFQNVHSCIWNHAVPHITVSVARRTAHNMHTACIASCIHVTKNSNNALPLLALRRASHMQLGSDHFIIWGGGGWKSFWKNNLALLLAKKNNLAQPVRWKKFFALICCKKNNLASTLKIMWISLTWNMTIKK